MGDALISDTKYRVVDSPLNNKPVISMQKEGIDELELAQNLRKAKVALTKPDSQKVSADSQKLTALDQLKQLMDTFYTANEPLMNYLGKDQTLGTDENKSNVFKNCRANFSYVSGLPAESYISATGIDTKKIGSSYNLQITQIAQTDVLQSTSSIPTPSAAQGLNGNFYINGTAIAIVPTDTMTTIIQKINAETSNINVTASMSQISPSNTNVMFFLTGTKLSTAIDLTPNALDPQAIDPSTFFLPAAAKYNGNTAAINAHEQTIQAAILMNGVTYYRNTNQINDLIDGVTLNAKEVMPTSSTLSIAMDTDYITEATINWINAYNNIKNFLKPHLSKAKDDDPDGKHVLYGNRIVESTLRMLNGFYWGLDGLLNNEKGILGSYYINFENSPLQDLATTLSYDAVKTPQAIAANAQAFLQTVGQNFTSTNPKVQVTRMPSELSYKIAGQPITFSISNVQLDVSGKKIFDVTVTHGLSTASLTGVSSNIINFSDSSTPGKYGVFDGLSLFYDATLPTVGGSDSATLTITKGVCADLDGMLSKYLKEPFNTDMVEKQQSRALAKIDWGDLSKEMFFIYQEKKGLEEKIEKAIQKADDGYTQSIRQLQSWSEKADKAKRTKGLLESYINPKH
jgi:flagellar capping protein FliD